ncbi:HAMP domain-containing protein [Actinomadura sp. J1-007]|nr:HAMP domain-containing protein [Actinomadura sp. J1-007]
MTVQQWVLLALTLVGLLVVASGAVGYALLTRTASTVDHLVDELSPARTEAYRLQAALVDQETGVRGYVLTGERGFLRPYQEGRRAERQSADRLASFVREEPEAAADLARVRALAADWQRTYAEPMIAQVGARGPGSVDAAMVGRGKAGFDRLRALWNDQNRHLDDAVAEGRDAAAHDRRIRDGVLGGMLVAILAAGALLAVVLHLAVGRPLAALGRSSRRVADGEFDHAIGVRGPADLRSVATDVEAMRHRIVEELGYATDRERQLQDRTADLDVQTAELRRSNGELEQFAYVASHDLQEPLRKVASFCQLLQRRYADQLDDRANQYIEFAVDGAKRMQVLINDLLTFSRVGRVYDRDEPLDLDEPLDKALRNLQGTLEETGARVERPERLPRVRGDMTPLTMLWQNLVGNAVKFRAPDRTPEVEIGCRETDEGWEFSVIDNGIGIAPEFADKVFVIFQRLHGRDAYEGTGIGLALCKKIVESYGGRIWLDTGRAEGAGIHFVLPRTDPGPDDAEAGSETGGDTARDPDTEGAA